MTTIEQDNETFVKQVSFQINELQIALLSSFK